MDGLRMLIVVGLLGSALAQVPQGVNVSIDERSEPELNVLMYWQPVAGATSYKVYRGSAGLGIVKDCSTITMTFDESVTAPTYSDSPNPGWYKIPVTGNWGSHAWCYAVSSVVGGVESAMSVPQMVTIGWEGYLNINYVTACVGGQVLIPFPYVHNEISMHFYYRDPAGKDHEYGSITVHYPYGGIPQNQEWETKLPTIALDGTVIPWSKDAYYFYEMHTPDGGSYSGDVIESAESRNKEQSSYSQLYIRRVLNGPDCGSPAPSNFWQNVTRE